MRPVSKSQIKKQASKPVGHPRSRLLPRMTSTLPLCWLPRSLLPLFSTRLHPRDTPPQAHSGTPRAESRVHSPRTAASWSSCGWTQTVWAGQAWRSRKPLVSTHRGQQGWGRQLGTKVGGIGPWSSSLTGAGQTLVLPTNWTSPYQKARAGSGQKQRKP